MYIFGKEVSSFDELVAVVEEAISSDGYFVDEMDGSLPTIDDLDDLEGLIESWVDEEDIQEFEKILGSPDAEKFDGIDFDVGDSMYHMSGGGFSSWNDYYRYRFG